MDQKVIDLKARRNSSSAATKIAPTKLLYPGVAAVSAQFLVDQEGESLARILGEAEAGLMVRLFESERIMGNVSRDLRPQVRELLRQLFEGLEKRLREKESNVLPFVPGVDRALELLEPDAIVCALRIFLARILDQLSNRQLALMSRAVMETVASLDRWAIRSRFQKEGLVREAFKRAELDAEGTEAAAFRVVKGWLFDWGNARLAPMVADDFEFFRSLIRHLPGEEILAEDEWRALSRALSLALLNTDGASPNDRAFALFRLLARSSRRLSFIQYLLHVHGRSLDMLGAELKDWLLVYTLVDESRDLSKPFRLWLNPGVVAEEAGLEAEDLKDFFEGLVEKMRLDRERFELDWFDQACNALHNVLFERERSQDWCEKASRKAESLASNIAADSSKKVSVSHLERIIGEICALAANAVTVAERPRDARWYMAHALSTIADFRDEGHIWRNGQRIASSLLNVLADQETEFAAKLQAALGMLQEQQHIHAGIPENLGHSLSKLDHSIAVLGCNLALFHMASQVVDNGQKAAHLLRDELLAGRLDLSDLEELSKPDTLEELIALCGMNETAAENITAVLGQQTSLAMLWMQRAELVAQRAAANDAASRYLYEIVCMVFMLPGDLVDRVDEEWSFWIAPQARQLDRIGFSSDDPNWRAFEDRIKVALTESDASRLQVFFKRIFARAKQQERNQSTSQLQPFKPLQLPQLATAGLISEPFRGMVEDFTDALTAARAPDWLSAFAARLGEHGDEERAWLSVYPQLLKALEANGQAGISAVFDEVMIKVIEPLDPLSRAHWFETLAEGRALTQQLAIGQVWLNNAESLAEVIAPQMRAAMNNEPDLQKCIRDLDFNFKHMGETLTEQTPVMAALELPRFWFQNVSPFVEYPPVLWRLVALSLRDATQKYLPHEMTVSVASWCHRFGKSAYKLASSRDFAAKTLQAKGNFFSENRRDELAWRALLAGLLVAASNGEKGRLPRSLLCQRLLEATPPLNNVTVEQWQNAANAIISKFRPQIDESLLPGLIESQAAVSKEIEFRQRLAKFPDLEEDNASWVRNRHKIGSEGKWRRYTALSSRRFGVAHPSHIKIPQLLDWKLPDEAFVKAQGNLYETVFKAPMSIQPDTIRVGVFKRKSPEIPADALASWRVRLIGYALGVAYGDDCCQRQCMLVARLTAMREWPFDALLELMRKIDEPIYLIRSTSSGAADMRVQVLNDSWIASDLAVRANEMARETVERWKPFGKSSVERNEKCIRDIAHVVKQIMLSSSGIHVEEGLDEWYNAHILQFVRDSAREPFSQLPIQLGKTFQMRFPKPVAEDLSRRLEPLKQLLTKD